METETEYDKQASAFVTATGLRIVKEYQGHRPYFPDDKEQRAVWSITLERDGRPSHTFTFGESIADSYDVFDHRVFALGKRLKQWPMNLHNLKGYKEVLAKGGGDIQTAYRLEKAKRPPSDYTILASVSSEAHAPETFEDFCSDYGYDTDSRRALDTFLAVQAQAAALRRMFTPDELDQLAEIS